MIDLFCKIWFLVFESVLRVGEKEWSSVLVTPCIKRKWKLHPMRFLLTEILKIFHCFLKFTGFWFESLIVSRDHGGLRDFFKNTKTCNSKTFQSNQWREGNYKAVHINIQAKRHESNTFIWVLSSSWLFQIWDQRE